jgi:hypothetical protein
MKNYKFVLAVLLSSGAHFGAHAASTTSPTQANHTATKATALGGVALQNLQANALTLERAAAPPAVHQLATLTMPDPALPVDHQVKDATLAKAFHYLDGDAAQGSRTQAKLAQQTAAAKNVSEPASEILLLAGLSALAIAVRRQSPS